jgi:hypothetical protein
LCIALTLTLVAAASAAAVHDHAHPDGTSRKPSSLATKNIARSVPAVTNLPPLPQGVAEIKFGDFFVRPVGTHGLELTDKLRQLDGQRVRILGFMVQEEEPPPGRLMLAPMPVQIHEHDNGLAEDLPASVMFVSVPTSPNAPVPFVPGLMLLTGTLSVGSRPEPDGRISLVRLALDPPDKFARARRSKKPFSTPVGKGAERLIARSHLNASSHP